MIKNDYRRLSKKIRKYKFTDLRLYFPTRLGSIEWYVYTLNSSPQLMQSVNIFGLLALSFAFSLPPTLRITHSFRVV